MAVTVENVGKLSVNDLIQEWLNPTSEDKVDDVIIKNGAINEVPGIVHKYGYKHPLLVCDANTFKAAGEKVSQLLDANAIEHKKFIYHTEHDLVPDETAVGKLLVAIDKNTDLLLVVGSGVLNDIGKFVSKKVHIPEILVATAPSMDGFISSTSAMTLNNLKSSVSCGLPHVIIGDIDILKKAPKRMILAGLGDMVGKYSALIDWNLSVFINSESYSNVAAKLSETAVEKCVKSILSAKDGEGFSDEAIQHIMEGLIGTGIAMSYVGNSRPASGSEHHLSHYWELMFLFLGKEALLHGTKVGLTSLIVAKIYEWFLKEENINFDKAEKTINNFKESEWEATITNLYKKAAPEIILKAKQDKRNDKATRLNRVKFIKEHLPEIKDIIRHAKKYSEVRSIMEKAGAPLYPQDVGIEQPIIHNSVLVAHEVRQRYTILNMLHDLDLLDKYAGFVDEFIKK